MKNGFFIGMRPGDKIYINGAVIRVNRKVSLELMNDVTFLLESHVLQPEQTTTPLRQLYFIVQTMLIDPGNAGNVRPMFDKLHELLLGSFANEQVLADLKLVHELVCRDRTFEALKTIRKLFAAEETVMSDGTQPGHIDLAKQLEDTSCR